MRWWRWVGTLFLGVWLGSVLQTHSLWPQAGAAPGDVFGSANIAVDSYRNRKGTYVVWSNGRVTDVSNPANDLGHPFRDPDATAGITAARVQEGQALGSPNVAVKAIPRGDATYVLFSDGTLKLPANAEAAAPAAVPGRVLIWNSPPGTYPDPGWHVDEEEFDLNFNNWRFTITLDEPMQGKRNGLGVFTAYNGSGIVSVGLVGRFSADGRTLVFDLNDLSGGYASGSNRPLGFQFVASSE